MNDPVIPPDPTATGRQRCEELVADLVSEAETAADGATKFDCLREAALMYEGQIGDPMRALVTWQAAFSEQPDNEQAALAIERLAEKLGSWHTVLPDAEAILEATRNPDVRASLLTWIARWLERYVGDESAAQRRLEEAALLAPGSPTVAEALSALHAARSDWAGAAEALERAGKASTNTDEAVGLMLEAARLWQSRQSEPVRAGDLYRRVLEMAPQNALAADGLADVASKTLDPALMCAQYRRQLETDPDNLGVVRQWAEVAFSHARLEDIRFLFERLFERIGGDVGAGRPDRRTRLNDALDRFVSARKWPEAVDVLRSLASDAAEGELRAKYYLAAGKIAQNELKNDEVAAELFNLSLDSHPGDMKTFERLFAIVSAKRAWTEAERDLKRMINRLLAAGLADNATMLGLWKRLGDVYRLGLRDLEQAAASYEECARLAPEDRRYSRLAAELAGRVVPS